MIQFINHKIVTLKLQSWKKNSNLNLRCRVCFQFSGLNIVFISAMRLKSQISSKNRDEC